MGTTESNVDHAASGQTVAGDSGELTFTYAQGRFASEGKDWESPVVTNMAASVSADAGNVPAGSITNTGTNNTFTSTTESSLATLLSNQCPFVIKATIFEGNGKNAIRERHTFTGAPLASWADVTLLTGRDSHTIYGNAIFSRVADTALVDMLYMGVILSDYGRFSTALDESGRMIRDRVFEN